MCLPVINTNTVSILRKRKVLPVLRKCAVSWGCLKHMFSQSSRGQKSEIRASAGPCSPEPLRRSLSGFRQLLWLPAPLGLYQYHSRLDPHLPDFSLCVCLHVGSPLLIRTRVILDQQPTRLQCGPLLPHCICTDPVSR